jgi:hypothetical protein
MKKYIYGFLLILTACGGGSGPDIVGPLLYDIEGFVTSSVSGAAVAGVTVDLAGDLSRSTTTDGTVQYSFTGIPNGSYALSAGLADTVFSPNIQPVAVSTADVSGLDFQATRGETLATGIEFLPQLFASDMARIAVDQFNVFILDGGLIKVVPLAGGTIEKLASAHLGSIADFSRRNMDIVADDTSVYWTVGGMGASPVVQKVAIGGGAPVTLAPVSSTTNPQDCYWRIAIDAQNVYWSQGSTTHRVGCAVKKVPINGGAVTTLVDIAFLADFTVDGVDVYFSELQSPTIQKTSIDGGPLTLVAEGSAAPLVLINDANNPYWIDLQFDTIGRISKAPGYGDD